LGLDVPLVIDSVAIKQMVQLSAIHVLLAWNGLRILQHRRLSFWIGALGSIPPWGYCSAIIFFGAPAMTIYDSNPVALWVQHSLIWLLFTLQLAAFVLALPAQRRWSKS
jgi:hypothetical protein